MIARGYDLTAGATHDARRYSQARRAESGGNFSPHAPGGDSPVYQLCVFMTNIVKMIDTMNMSSTADKYM